MTHHIGRYRFCTTVLFLLTVVSLPSGSAAVQSRPPKDPDPTLLRSDWEQWRDPVPVSGGLRVGVMSAGDSRFNPAQLTVWLPRTDAPFLCVEVTSQDGRYVASVPYDIRGDPPGPRQMKFPPSKHTSKLREFDSGQLAILARLAKSCGTAPVEAGDFVIAGWDQPRLGETVVVLLNSRLPTSIVAGKGNTVESNYPCQSLTGTTTAFNLRCEIPVNDVTGDRDYFIQMRRGSGFSAPVPLPLAIPR